MARLRGELKCSIVAAKLNDSQGLPSVVKIEIILCLKMRMTGNKIMSVRRDLWI